MDNKLHSNICSRPGSVSPASSHAASERPPRIPRTQPPQDTLKQFWNRFNTRYPGKVFTVLPDNPYVRTKAANLSQANAGGDNDTAKTYEQAKKECEVVVNRIVRECRRVNQKYTDVHFDIEYDLKCGRRDFLDGLNNFDENMQPKGVKRVTVRFLPSNFCLFSSDIYKTSRISLNVHNFSSAVQLPMTCGRDVMETAGSWQHYALSEIWRVLLTRSALLEMNWSAFMALSFTEVWGPRTLIHGLYCVFVLSFKI
jgi:hypothetical protein